MSSLLIIHDFEVLEAAHQKVEDMIFCCRSFSFIREIMHIVSATVNMF